jgi:predicted oxidoreductase
MLPISKLIAGTMTWGSWGKKLNTSQMEALIQLFYNQNITTFDHADIYGAHTTEAEFGKAFKQSKINRENVQFISKCGIKYPAENRNYSLKHYDYSDKHMVWSVDQSLKNLQTDYLDILLLHRPSPLMNTEEIGVTINKLKKEGKILDFGVSNFSNEQSKLIQKNVEVNYNQIQFSLTNFEAMNNGVLDFMQTKNIKPMAWNPLGTFFTEDSIQNQRIKQIIDQFKLKYNLDSDLILLAWILQHPSKISPVVGTATLERIEKLGQLIDFKLDLEDWFFLYEASLGNKVP